MRTRLLVLLALLTGAALAGAALAAAPSPSLLLQGSPLPPIPSPVVDPPSPADVAPALGRGVGAWIDRGVAVDDFGTGHAGFDREWLFGSYQMAALGYGRLAAADPDNRAAWLARMEACLDRLRDRDTRAFDTRSWNEEPFASDRGHAAWLGYTGLAFSLHRTLVPDSPYAADEARIADALAVRLAAHPLPETYPGERYPVDIAAGVGALLLHARATGGDDALPRRWLDETLPTLRDADTGLLVQAVDARGRPVDRPRGSGTFLASWFLGLAGAPEGAALYRAGRAALYDEVLGLGVMREYPADRPGAGDIDSGPIFLGYGVSPTGFAIGAAALAGDRETARSLFATAEAFGGPEDTVDDAGAPVRRYRAGGPIGDTILFAMSASDLSGPTTTR